MFTRRLLKFHNPNFHALKRLITNGDKRRVMLEPKIIRGIDYAREPEEEEMGLFPAISQLGVSTFDKIHRFEVDCDQVIKLIKMGAINKNITAQYCHYLAELTRVSDVSEKEYFGTRVMSLASYLLRNNKDLTIRAQITLITDASDTTASNCFKLCNHVIDQPELGNEFVMKEFIKILSSCYKFGLWELASTILTKFSADHKIVNPRLIDHLITALPSSVELYNSLDQDSEDKKRLRNDLLEHIFRICEESHNDRVQFITKHIPEFLKAMEDLNLKVVKNPVIKMSGRCTNCNSFLPMYNHQSTVDINNSIKRVLHDRYSDKYNVHSSPQDLESFEQYLEKIYRIDKKPIDLVIDGLNIAFKNTLGAYYVKKSVQHDFKISEKRHNVGNQAQVLINSIIRGNMLQSFRKILIIGRDHMRGWPGLLEFFEKQKIHYYLSKNQTKDDLFQLYAATLNPKTLLVTGDFLRDHLAMLELNDRVALERWIDTHQVWIQSKTLKPIWPTPYEKIPSTQRETGHFHVPMIDFNKLETIGDHEPPPHLNNKMTSWVCCHVES